MPVLKSYAQRFWEDVADGEQLPRIEMALPFRKLVLNAAATRDFFPGHHDPEYARSQNQKTVYINTMFFQGFIDRVVTDWAGPEAFICRRKTTMQRSVYAGDTMYGEGRVTNRRVQDGRHLVDIDLVVGNQDGPACSASVTVQLPSRREVS
jgi:acyl dehydratase